MGRSTSSTDRRRERAAKPPASRWENSGARLTRRLAGLVDAASFVIGRYDPEGRPIEVSVSSEATDPTRHADWLTAERFLQASVAGSLPRVTGTIAPVSPFASGLTLAFGSDDAIAAIAILLRRSDEAPFGQVEIARLEAALPEAATLIERISDSDADPDPALRASGRARPATFILDDDFRVAHAWLPEGFSDDPALRAAMPRNGRFPAIVESAIRSLASNEEDESDGDTIFPVPGVLVRAFPLAGEDGARTGVVIERLRGRDPLGTAAQRFSMSSRELEIVTLLLQGRGTAGIARSLGIAESTVHDHIRRMLAKTRSHNRVELAAKALGWRAN